MHHTWLIRSVSERYSVRYEYFLPESSWASFLDSSRAQVSAVWFSSLAVQPFVYGVLADARRHLFFLHSSGYFIW